MVPAASVIPKPSTLSFEQASGMMLTGVTAVHALTVIRASAGETILIYGAAGSLTSIAAWLLCTHVFSRQGTSLGTGRLWNFAAAPAHAWPRCR